MLSNHQQLILNKQQQVKYSDIITNYEKGSSKEDKEEEGEEEEEQSITLTSGQKKNCWRCSRHRHLMTNKLRFKDVRSTSSKNMTFCKEKEEACIHCPCDVTSRQDLLKITTQEQQQQQQQHFKQIQTENNNLDGDSSYPISNKNDNRTRLNYTATVVRWCENNCTTRVVTEKKTKRSNCNCQSSSSLFRGMFKPLLLMMFLLVLSFNSVNANFHKALARAITEEPPPTFTNSSKRVCRSIDIRNKITEFDKLKGCRVVEGFVQIILIHKTDSSAFKDIVFPDLVEITGYLLLFRVQGLRSIGHLFPNLAVIRGSQILFNYAFAVFELMDLREIGLYSLTDIVKGSVRIDKNPFLCYADTIDWNQITKSGKGENYIGMNKQINECPVCDKHCPDKPSKPDEKLCWNKSKCQKVCNNCGDRACTPSGECCHKSCLGGCTGPTEFNCTACRDVIVNDNQCVSTCPPDMYTFFGRRCITAQQCRMTRKPREMTSNMRTNPYKPFNGKCEIECPVGFEEVRVNDEYSCKQCIGRCYKECAGTIVDNMNSAQRLRGCTFINGSLEIAIRDAQNVVKELEVSLSQIEVITGYLRIFRNYPLVSLNFLKSLKEIRGMYLDMKEYSLVVLNNPNLQELWNFENRTKLKIYAKDKNEAKMLFHYNSKLCVQTIEKLREHTGLKPFSEIEVSKLSNGDRASCNITTLMCKISAFTSKVAMIVWEPFKHYDRRKLLGYTIYLKEAPAQNVSLYEARDACGGDGWRVQDIIPENPLSTYIGPPNSLDGPMADVESTIYNIEKNNTQLLKSLVYELKPNTQYAFYVKTYMISGEQTGGQSPIQYFTTLPGQPSSVRALAVYASGSDTLVIEWLPPTEPNSVLSYYMVFGTLETYDADLFKLRDYCEEPIIPEFKTPQMIAAEGKEKAEKELEASKQPELLPFSCDKPIHIQSENEIFHSIAFEDALHNQVYIRRGNSRRKRNLSLSIMLDSVNRVKRDFNSLQEKDTINHNKKTGDLETKKRDRGDPYKKPDDLMLNNSNRFQMRVPANQTRVVIHNLRNYGKYNIAVKACRDYDPKNKEDNCSPDAIKSYQTLRKELADDIPKDSFKISKISGNNSTPIVKLSWQEPPHPNGIIVSYHIEYKRINVSGHKQDTLCLTSENFIKNGSSFIMPTSLAPGNYSVRVLATSLAGHGAYTPTLFFNIPELNVGRPLWQIIIAILLGVASLVGFITASVFWIRFRRSLKIRLVATVNPEYEATLLQGFPPIVIEVGWELERSNITLLNSLGSGSFGMVYAGLYNDKLRNIVNLPIAVKTVTENSTAIQKYEFLKEANVMKNFQSYHIVKLLGIVVKSNPTLVVMELMANGDLKNFLRARRPNECEDGKETPTEEQLLMMAIEIADGMAYLESNKFVHRDLAARNIMVSEDMTVKIGDFGMTRDIYETDYYRKGTKGLLPVRWMPPEALKDGVFSSMSDVWSFGVVLWEMLTYCAQPYPGLANDQVLQYVIEGGIMSRPPLCRNEVYDLMINTWKFKPTDRPTFSEIIELFMPLIDVESFKKHSYYFHTEEFREPPSRSELKWSLPDITEQGLQRLENQEKEEQLEMHKEAPEDVNENSPLRQDFHQNFSSAFDPLENGGAAATVALVPKKETRFKPTCKMISSSPRTTLSFLDLDSSKTPLKAGFDDFDGVSSAAASLTSSKDTLNLPFVEENISSVKSSPYNLKNSSSRGNISHRSTSRSSLSPQSPSIMVGSNSPGNRPSPSLVASSRSDHNSENRSPSYEVNSSELLQSSSAPFCGSRTSLRFRGNNKNPSGFPSMDAIDKNFDLGTVGHHGVSSSFFNAETTTSTPLLTTSTIDSVCITMPECDDKQQQEQDQQQQQSAPPTSLNNGYISSGPAT